MFWRNLFPLSLGYKFLPHHTASHHITEYCNRNIHRYQNNATQVHNMQFYYAIGVSLYFGHLKIF
jgi:hypothetical protein